MTVITISDVFIIKKDFTLNKIFTQLFARKFSAMDAAKGDQPNTTLPDLFKSVRL
jgi:hypothetical protein